MKQTLTELEEYTDSSTFGDFFTPLSIKNRTSQQKINKETEDLNNIKNQLNLWIHTALLSTTAIYMNH